MESKFRMYWTLFVQADAEEQAKKAFHEFEKLMERKNVGFEIFPYWKDTAQYKMVVTFPLNAEDSSSATCEALQLAWRVVRRVVVTNPQLFVGNNWEFHGSEFSESDIFVEGVKMVSFVVQDFD